MKSLRRDLLVLLFFTLLALLMTWPLITRIGTAYAGNNEDLWTFQWDNWWTRLALQHGFDVLYTSYQFYPGGVSLAAHSLSFYNSLIWIPLSALWGDIAAYNVTILLTFILSGYTMFKLAQYLLSLHPPASGDPPATLPALLAGIIFTFAPYHFSQSLGHVSLASVQWFPLLALFALKAVRERTWRNPIALGGLILLITATRLQFIVLGAVTFALFVLVDWLVLRREWVRGAIIRLAAGALLGLMLCLPMVLPAMQLYTTATLPDNLIADEQVWGQTDLLAYALPMTYHPVFGPLLQPIYENFAKNQAWMPYLGYTTLALALWGALRRPRRRALPWISVGLFLFIMALGPFLRVNGVPYVNLKLPYTLIGDRFPLNTLRSPDRYNLLLAMALAPLAALGLADILRRLNDRRLRATASVHPRPWPGRHAGTLVGVIAGAFILFEYLGLPYPTIAPLPASPFYARLAADPEPYAVLDIPLERSDTKRYLYYQTLHGHPIVEGRVARVPAEAYALFNRIPLLKDWQHSLDNRPADPGHQLALLNAQNVRYLILHKDLLEPRLSAALRDYLARVPVYEDDQIAVYSTRPETDAITPIGGGLGLVTSWVAVQGADQPIKVRVRWAAVTQPDRNYQYRLALVGEDGSTVLEQAAPLEPASATWQPGEIVVSTIQLTPAPTVPLGRYHLRLSVLAADQVVGTIELSHSILNVPSRTGSWIMPVTEEPGVRFGPAIELRAADVSRRGNLLSLWLHWHALTAPGIGTKYFVHVLDAAGNVVAQDDGIYVHYTRPSSGWRADEMISDLIEIPVWGLKPGEYRLSVGLTNSATGERLPAVDAAGRALPENRYLLTETLTIQ